MSSTVIEQPTDTMAFLSSPLYHLASWYGHWPVFLCCMGNVPLRPGWQHVCALVVIQIQSKFRCCRCKTCPFPHDFAKQERMGCNDTWVMGMSIGGKGLVKFYAVSQAWLLPSLEYCVVLLYLL